VTVLTRVRWAREKARVHSSDRSGQWDEDWDTKSGDGTGHAIGDTPARRTE
jgi:hypothetical protein